MSLQGASDDDNKAQRSHYGSRALQCKADVLHLRSHTLSGSHAKDCDGFDFRRPCVKARRCSRTIRADWDVNGFIACEWQPGNLFKRHGENRALHEFVQLFYDMVLAKPAHVPNESFAANWRKIVKSDPAAHTAFPQNVENAGRLPWEASP